MFELLALLTLLVSLMAPADVTIDVPMATWGSGSSTVEASDDGLPLPPGGRR
jgi:hypothetical protein